MDFSRTSTSTPSPSYPQLRSNGSIGKPHQLFLVPPYLDVRRFSPSAAPSASASTPYLDPHSSTTYTSCTFPASFCSSTSDGQFTTSSSCVATSTARPAHPGVASPAIHSACAKQFTTSASPSATPTSASAPPSTSVHSYTPSTPAYVHSCATFPT
jgi:hypothetical protein